ncbi:MAG: hypothetical protein H7259_10035 [Cytophagales bacterium]|nr:hypothetical protein [Cytophaga sp.]
MKRLLIITVMICLFSCSGKKHYHMSNHEQKNQKGYHATQAKKIVDKNAKNRASNQKTAEKNRQKTNEAASTKAADGKKPAKHSGIFNFYAH